MVVATTVILNAPVYLYHLLIQEIYLLELPVPIILNANLYFVKTTFASLSPLLILILGTVQQIKTVQTVNTVSNNLIYANQSPLWGLSMMVLTGDMKTGIMIYIKLMKEILKYPVLLQKIAIDINIALHKWNAN